MAGQKIIMFSHEGLRKCKVPGFMQADEVSAMDHLPRGNGEQS